MKKSCMYKAHLRARVDSEVSLFSTSTFSFRDIQSQHQLYALVSSQVIQHVDYCFPEIKTSKGHKTRVDAFQNKIIKKWHKEIHF